LQAYGARHFFGLPIAVPADFIVSGDIHLLEMKKYGKIVIISAKEYLEAVQS